VTDLDDPVVAHEKVTAFDNLIAVHRDDARTAEKHLTLRD